MNITKVRAEMLSKETLQTLNEIDNAYNMLRNLQRKGFDLLDSESDADELLDSYGTVFKQTDANHALFAHVNLQLQNYLDSKK